MGKKHFAETRRWEDPFLGVDEGGGGVGKKDFAETRRWLLYWRLGWLCLEIYFKEALLL